MNKAFALFATLALSGQAVFAADVFVRSASGEQLDANQKRQVTDQVKRAVRGMPEHTLVNSASEADFVLEPSVVTRGEEMVLRIEKTRDGDIIALAEEPIPSSSQPDARRATETAMVEDQYVSGGSQSATSQSASDSGMSAAGERSITSSPTEDASSSSRSSSSTMSEPDSLSGSTGSDTTSTDDLAARDSGSPAPDVRAPSPAFANPDRLGYFQIGAGPAIPLGMDSSQVMYNINGAYAIDINHNLTGKVFGDFNLPTGGDDARFINVGLAAEIYPAAMERIAGGRPYISGDVGYAFTRRNDTDERADNIAIGGGVGYKFAAAALNLDVNAHYTILTEQIQGSNPSVLGFRVALNF